MPMVQVVLRLARNPGFPDGRGNQGNVLHAPLKKDGKLSIAESGRRREGRQVIRHERGQEHDADGFLSHRGARWRLDCDEEVEGEDKPPYRIGNHSSPLGGYVTIHESNGGDATYRVGRHLPMPAGLGSTGSQGKKKERAS